MQDKIGMHFLVKGRVQGVWFRASTQEEAKALEITGWVCNTKDGHVEVLACGERAKVMALHEWLKVGPELARVETVEHQEVPWQEFDRFYIK